MLSRVHIRQVNLSGAAWQLYSIARPIFIVILLWLAAWPSLGGIEVIVYLQFVKEKGMCYMPEL